MASYHHTPLFSSSASGVSVPRRNPSSSNVPSFRATSSSVASGGRPRSLYGNSSVSGITQPYSSGSSSYYNTSPGASSPYLNNLSSIGSPLSSYNASPSTYGGTLSGYGGLSIPGSSSSHSLSSLGHGYSSSSHGYFSNSPTSSPSSNSSYLSNFLQSSSSAQRSSSPSTYASRPSSRTSDVLSRSSSFNRHGHSPLLSSNLNSRSSSVASLATSVKSNDSEGYSSCNDRSSSRLSSVSAGGGDGDTGDRSYHHRLSLSAAASAPPTNENGEIDYKKLYEQSQLENEALREKLRKSEQDLQEVKVVNDDSNAAKGSLSEVEKRERRALERKLSEMEEELKQMEQLRNENQKLKDENGALIRVISKLSK